MVAKKQGEMKEKFAQGRKKPKSRFGFEMTCLSGLRSSRAALGKPCRSRQVFALLKGATALSARRDNSTARDGMQAAPRRLGAGRAHASSHLPGRPPAYMPAQAGGIAPPTPPGTRAGVGGRAGGRGRRSPGRTPRGSSRRSGSRARRICDARRRGSRAPTRRNRRRTPPSGR